MTAVSMLMSTVLAVSLLIYVLCFMLPLSWYRHCPILGDGVYKFMSLMELEYEGRNALHMVWGAVVCLVFLGSPSRMNMLVTLLTMVVNCWVIWSMSWIGGARRRCRVLHAKAGLH